MHRALRAVCGYEQSLTVAVMNAQAVVEVAYDVVARRQRLSGDDEGERDIGSDIPLFGLSKCDRRRQKQRHR